MRHPAQVQHYIFLMMCAGPEKVTKLQKTVKCDFSGKNHQNNGGPRFSTSQIFQFQRALPPSLTTPRISPTNNVSIPRKLQKELTNAMAE